MLEGWICPRCRTVWAPCAAKCTCLPPMTVGATSGIVTSEAVRCCCHLKDPRSTAKVTCPVHDSQITYTVG